MTAAQSDTNTNGTERKVCLDLFAGLGGFSAAFDDADDWDVFTVEIKDKFNPDFQADVLELRPDDLLDLIGEFDRLVILAGHPCTVFTNIRRITKGGDEAWDGDKPASTECRNHVAMVYHTLGLIGALAPDYWFLENPRGRLRDIIGQPETTVWYCQYGHDNAKPTDLWGDHPPTFVPRRCYNGNDDCDHVKTESYKEHGGGSDKRQGLLEENDSAERAEVPYELSKSIHDAVDEAFRGDYETKQQTLVADGGAWNSRSETTDTEQSDD